MIERRERNKGTECRGEREKRREGERRGERVDTNYAGGIVSGHTAYAWKAYTVFCMPRRFH